LKIPADEIALKYKELWMVEHVFYALHIVMQSDTIRLFEYQLNTSNTLQYRFA